MTASAASSILWLLGLFLSAAGLVLIVAWVTMLPETADRLLERMGLSEAASERVWAVTLTGTAVLGLIALGQAVQLFL